mmetsp:Transcript_32459/g.100431  ORF Transcript_32459/g.100431 Transcript_32459/m.100431 type:complete len:238 (-) Transcript_32459:1362-2075(-)
MECCRMMDGCAKGHTRRHEVSGRSSANSTTRPRPASSDATARISAIAASWCCAKVPRHTSVSGGGFGCSPLTNGKNSGLDGTSSSPLLVENVRAFRAIVGNGKRVTARRIHSTMGAADVSPSHCVRPSCCSDGYNEVADPGLSTMPSHDGHTGVDASAWHAAHRVPIMARRFRSASSKFPPRSSRRRRAIGHCGHASTSSPSENGTAHPLRSRTSSVACMQLQMRRQSSRRTSFRLR